MKYLVGNLGDMEGEFGIYKPFFTDELTKDMLIKSKEMDDYGVINIITGEYFSADLNKWIKMENK